MNKEKLSTITMEPDGTGFIYSFPGWTLEEFEEYLEYLKDFVDPDYYNKMEIRIRDNDRTQ